MRGKEKGLPTAIPVNTSKTFPNTVCAIFFKASVPEKVKILTHFLFKIFWSNQTSKKERETSDGEVEKN